MSDVSDVSVLIKLLWNLHHHATKIMRSLIKNHQISVYIFLKPIICKPLKLDKVAREGRELQVKIRIRLNQRFDPI